MKAPYVPDAAPFNEDQKAWLAGFLAGLHSRAVMNTDPAAPTASAGSQKAPELNLLVGTQTGTAESVAEDIADLARESGLSPKIEMLDDVSMDQLVKMDLIIVVISTYGEGEMPDNAQLFWEAFSATTMPRMEQAKFGVLALGDTGYEHFCQAGKLMDTRFEQLGAKRLLPRIDCDVDYEEAAETWMNDALPLFKNETGDVKATAQHAPTSTEPKKSKPAFNRKKPYLAETLENTLLSGPSSAKEIRHFSFSLGESGLSYEAGDALGVFPKNSLTLVNAILEKIDADHEMQINGFDQPLSTVLQTKLEIRTPPKEFISAIAERIDDDELSSIVTNGDREALDAYMWQKDTLDLLNMSEKKLFDAEEFISLLKPLQHRAYSISSSPNAHENEVHLTIASVRWMYENREHQGVCSTYLADSIEAGDKVPIFMSPNKNFRVPEDNTKPIIMVGPGTGIAPFRAFLEERRARGATGKNWLFFGDQHRAHDYIYEDEISSMNKDGLLTRLDLAFSRDQDEKFYVQTCMKQNGKELFSWLEEGGYFYVCGDATRMARDVDDMLHQIITKHGSLSTDQAVDYVNNLKRDKRYLRDVY